MAKNTKTKRQSVNARIAEKLGDGEALGDSEDVSGSQIEDAPESAPPVEGKVLQSLADMLIAEAARMRADEVPADVQAAVRSLRKWRAK